MRDQIQKLTKNAAENYTEANDRILDAVVETNRKVVEFAVKAADQVVDQIEQIDRLPELPFAENVPTPAEAGARYIEFVERAVEMNREFTQRVVESLQVEEPVAPAPAAKKSTAKKSTAKKSGAKKASAKKTASKATSKAT